MAYRVPTQGDREGAAATANEPTAQDNNVPPGYDRRRSLTYRPPTPPKPSNISRRSTVCPAQTPNGTCQRGVNGASNGGSGIHPRSSALNGGESREKPRPVSAVVVPPPLLPKPPHLRKSPAQKRKTSEEVVPSGAAEKHSELHNVAMLNGTASKGLRKQSPSRLPATVDDQLCVKDNFFADDSISPPAPRPAAKSHHRDDSSHRKKGDYGREMKAFMAISEEICNALKNFHERYRDCERQLRAIEQTKHVLEEKEICITVFGQHNCGKSTFLNALIGEDILPVLAMSETSIKVKIQHNGDIHTGVCPRDCKERDNKCCPQLAVMKRKEILKEVFGPHNIYSYLQQWNKEVRQSHKRNSVDTLTVILKVNIPLLSGSIPPGWTVSIMDNPGFGEAKEHITQLAEASMVTSSAYIYLMQTENVGGREAAEFFTELLRTDQRAIIDGRLTIGITKFDMQYENSKMNKRGCVTVEMVKERIVENVQEVTETVLSNDVIIPICGEWALAGSKLANSLIAGPKNEREARYKEAASVLQHCPILSLPGGQGQSYDDAILGHFKPVEVVEKLESVSGVSDLKARIGYVVGSACVKVWATKIHTQLQNTLYEVKMKIEESVTKKENDHQCKLEKHSNSTKLLREIKERRQAILATLLQGKDKTSSEAWKDFETSYAKDLEKSKPQDIGKRTANTLIIEFRDMCKRKIENKQLGPAEFEDCLKEFLEASEAKLQEVFDTSCGFWNSQSVLMERNAGVIKNVSSMKRSADMLMTSSPMLEASPADVDKHKSIDQVRKFRNIMNAPPKLGDIKLKVPIPQVSLPWWKKIVHFFRGLLRQADNMPSSSAPPDPLPYNDSESCNDGASEAQATSNSVCEAYQPDIDDASDIYSIEGPWVESPVTEEEDEKSSGASAQLLQPNPSNVYKEWTSELEETVRKVQMYMNEACERYFVEIKHKAVKYFYRDYYLRAKDQLEEFNQEFGEPLRREEEGLEKLQREINITGKELRELKKAKNKLSVFEMKLCEAYAKFTQEQVEHSQRETLKNQDRSIHEELKLAKEKAKIIKEQALLVTEIDSL